MPIPTSSEIQASDKSKQILDSLFGMDWNLWGTGSLAGADGTSTHLMFQIFEAFNTVALAVVAGLFIFTTILAVVGTAHEGSPMGKNYNAFWTPVRFVCSISGLAPIFKGLSLFQVAILACIGWSISLGNFIYEIGSSYYLKHTSEFEVQPINENEVLRDITNDIFKSLAIQAYLKNERGRNIEIGSANNWHYDEDFIGTDGEWEYIFTGLRGNQDLLGTINVHCASEDSSVMNLCNKNKEALAKTINTLIPLATALADPKISAENIDRQALYKAEKTLSSDILKNVNQYINSDQDFKKKFDSYYSSTDEIGWIAAGATYWAISWINQETQSLANSNIESKFHYKSMENFLANTHGTQASSGILERIDNFISTAYGSQKGIQEFQNFSGEDGSELLAILSILNKNLDIHTLIEELTTKDPIMHISTIGNSMINWAIGIYGTITTMSAFTLLPFVGESLDTSVQILSQFGLYAITIPLFLYGVYLAFYLPSIPFIRWVSALFSWLILVVEALIAAPLWIAAHALPEGEGFAGNHARRGYFLLMAIIIRPALMVSGFFIAVIMINAVGEVIGTIFMLLYNTLPDYAVGLTGSLSFTVIIGSIIVMAANKIFGLITWLPDNVSNWIGQQLHSLGEDNDVNTAKHAFSGSTHIVSSLRASPSPVGVKLGKKNSSNINDNSFV